MLVLNNQDIIYRLNIHNIRYSFGEKFGQKIAFCGTFYSFSATLTGCRYPIENYGYSIILYLDFDNC